MSDGRRVNFSDSPPLSATSSRYASDDGATPPSNAADYPGGVDQWTDLEALQEAYHKLSASRSRWKARAMELEEIETKWHAVVERNEQLEEENQRLFKDKKAASTKARNLEDDIVSLRQELAEANARCNELQCNVAPPFVGGASPGNPGPISGAVDHRDGGLPAPAGGGPSSSSKDARRSAMKSPDSSSSNGSSSAHGSHSSSHSSSHARVGSSNSSSTSTAKISRSNSKHDAAVAAAAAAKDSEKEQKIRLSQRFDPKAGDNYKSGDSNASTSSAASSSSHANKHHTSSSSHHPSNHHSGHHGSSSGSNGSSEGAGSGGSGGGGGGVAIGSRPSRNHRYVEPFGPSAPPRPTKHASAAAAAAAAAANKGVPRSGVPQPVATNPGGGMGSMGGMGGMGGMGSMGSGGSHYVTYSPTQTQHQHFGPPPTSTAYMSPRGADMTLNVADGPRGSMAPQIMLYEENPVDQLFQEAPPNYYGGNYAVPRDPAHRQRHAR